MFTAQERKNIFGKTYYKHYDDDGRCCGYSFPHKEIPGVYHQLNRRLEYIGTDFSPDSETFRKCLEEYEKTYPYHDDGFDKDYEEDDDDSNLFERLEDIIESKTEQWQEKLSHMAERLENTVDGIDRYLHL